MKTWLAKLRISAALDRGESLRADVPNVRRRTEQMKRFEASMRELDSRLRANCPTVSEPVDLHASIMRAVRAAEKPSRLPFTPSMRWLAVPAAAALVLALWWVLNRPPAVSESASSPSLMAAAAALEEGQQLTERAPGVALAPLSDELEFLRRDVSNAVGFLLASVP